MSDAPEMIYIITPTAGVPHLRSWADAPGNPGGWIEYRRADTPWLPPELIKRGYSALNSAFTDDPRVALREILKALEEQP